MSAKAIVIVVFGFLWSCTATPVVSGIEPTHGDCAADIPVRIRGSGFGPEIQADLRAGSVGRVEVTIGDVNLRDVAVLGGAVIAGTLPGGRLEAGASYDVVVRTATGYSATLPGAFHCEGEPNVDAGDEGVDVVDDGEQGEADAGGPIGPVLTISQTATLRHASAASVAWVAERWVVAWVDDVGTSAVLRLAEIYPGESQAAAVRDIDAETAGLPVDPLVRAWGGLVWLGWVDRSTTPPQFRFKLLDDALGTRAAGGSLGNAEPDVFWRRDHDVAREPMSGAMLFVGPMLGGPAYALVHPDGSLAVRATPLSSNAEGTADMRAVWAGDGFRVLWTEGPASNERIRGAVVTAAGTASGEPFDLPLTGATAGPVAWVDDRTQPAHLLLCYVRMDRPLDRRVAYRVFDLGLGSAGEEVLLMGSGRLVRCAVAGGLLAWSVQYSISSFWVAKVGTDGSTTLLAGPMRQAVRAVPGLDIAAGPGGYALVWLEHWGAGSPVTVHFAEVAAER